MSTLDRRAVARATLRQVEVVATRLQTARTLAEVTEIYDALDAVLNTGLATALGCSVDEIEAAVPRGSRA
jgi:hypothetical protein